MRIVEFLKVEAVTPALVSTTKSDVLKELAQTLTRANPTISAERFHTVLSEREKLVSTGMERGVAIPHGRLAELPGLTACFAVSKAGIDFQSHDGKPAHFFFALVAPENSAGLHLKALSKINRLFRSEQLKEGILQATSAEDIYALIAQEDARA
jgi:PTS system nitrogen regulatory IIA component